MAFPVFLSLAFYLPASLVVDPAVLSAGKTGSCRCSRWRWCLYDFYLGYSALAFMSHPATSSSAFKRPGVRVWPFLRERRGLPRADPAGRG
ncbi:MAG: hypothetical protein MZU97_10320 [Bacillus subtilis]|nr:hypothetical protein [Bacillus subtilis]